LGIQLLSGHDIQNLTVTVIHSQEHFFFPEITTERVRD
jgi:hypothetical protein